MSQALPDVRCWICKRNLEIWTDGDGATVTGCPPCRKEIERLQAFERRMAPPVRRKVPSRRRYQRCRREELQRARVIAQLKGLGEAARETGLKYATLWWHAKREGWRLQGRGRKALEAVHAVPAVKAVVDEAGHFSGRR